MANRLLVDGTWIDGAAPPPAGNPGLTLGQLTGVWIDGAPAAVPGAPGLTVGQLLGYWIDGSTQTAVELPDIGGGSPPGKARRIRQTRPKTAQGLEIVAIAALLAVYLDDE